MPDATSIYFLCRNASDVAWWGSDGICSLFQSTYDLGTIGIQKLVMAFVPGSIASVTDGIGTMDEYSWYITFHPKMHDVDNIADAIGQFIRTFGYPFWGGLIPSRGCALFILLMLGSHLDSSIRYMQAIYTMLVNTSWHHQDLQISRSMLVKSKSSKKEVASIIII
jgi:hypothetical protein